MTTMRYPLTLRGMFERAERYFPAKQIVSRMPSGVVRHTYREYGERVRRLAAALLAVGVRKGDRVATLAWNHHRHLEAYFAIPSIGAVLHTLNLRLPPAHLGHVISHAGDKVILVDADLVPLLENLGDALSGVQHIVVMTDDPALPATSLRAPLSYEAVLAGAAPLEQWPEIDEWDPAGICYSSATTGLPKGVMYTHRALWLHSMQWGLADTGGVSEQDTMLIIVPMFHANAWGLPFTGVWMGTTQVLPGPRPDARVFCRLMEREGVTLAAGVPTVWMGVLDALETCPADLFTLTRIICGGMAAPRALIERVEQRLGVRFIHAYGMTEAAPLTHTCSLKRGMRGWDQARQYAVKAKQGLTVPGIEMRVVGPTGTDVPPDGATMGEIWLRGPWVADEYYNDARSEETFADGWYRTGDVGMIDAEGYLTVADRVKDIIKSGGEWISSVDLENAIMAHPAVAEAAVVGVAHPKWQERPLACVVLKPGARATRDDILGSLGAGFASWWLPDDVVFIDEVPKTSVGKFNKKALRERFATYLEARQATSPRTGG